MDYIVAAVDEAINLLMLVAQHPGNGLTELSKRSGNTKARTYRLLCTLEQRGLVGRRGDAAEYFLGFTAVTLGAAANEQVDLPRIVEPSLIALEEQFRETVVLRVRDGFDSLCVARRDSSRSLRVNSSVGSRYPLHAGASGKLLLAHAPEAFQAEVLARELERATKATPVSAQKLQQMLDTIREQGYATSNGEWVEDVAAVACPVRDANGQVVASLSISTPSQRMTDANVVQFIKHLRIHAAQVSSLLGYRAG